jgi:hypothetical protein
LQEYFIPFAVNGVIKKKGKNMSAKIIWIVVGAIVVTAALYFFGKAGDDKESPTQTA